MTSKFINLTPHQINLFTNEKEIVLPPSGQVARLKSEFLGNGLIQDRIDLEIIDLPEPRESLIYVTSSVVMAEACRLGRTDVVSPGGDRRNKSGQINGTTFFQRKAQKATV